MRIIVELEERLVGDLRAAIATTEPVTIEVDGIAVTEHRPIDPDEEIRRVIHAVVRERILAVLADAAAEQHHVAATAARKAERERRDGISARVDKADEEQ
jgi:hypothetical protein